MAFRFVLDPVLKEKRFTPERLSKETGVSLETISSLCDGNATDFSLNELDRICSALQCGPADIIKDMKGDWHIVNIKTGDLTPTNTFDI